MSHEALIRQACSLTVSSSSQLLTQVLVAIIDTSKEYREAMFELMSLLENNILLLSNSGLPLQNEIEDLIVAQRNAVDDHRRAIMELVSLMDHVEKMVTLTAETAFLAGAEQSSTLMCERLNSILEKVTVECSANKAAEEELLKLQQTYVLRLGESQISEETRELPIEDSDRKDDKIISYLEAEKVLNQNLFEGDVDENSFPR